MIRLHRLAVALLLPGVLIGAAAAAAPPASADDAGAPDLVTPDTGWFQLHGFGEMQVRGLADDFRGDRAYLSQWAMTLTLEPEVVLLTDRWGPLDRVSAYSRISVRYDCVWTGCGIARSWTAFGNRATHAPARNWTNAQSLSVIGGIDLAQVGIPTTPINPTGTDLLDFTALPSLAPYYDVGISRRTVQNALGPVVNDLFAFKRIDGPSQPLAFPLGPWRPTSVIRSNGALSGETSTVLPLPMRPAAGSLFTPSSALRQEIDDFGSFHQNFSQTELAWDQGASQTTSVLREAYLDIEMFDSRLFLRAGKQTIVWGKTELFRTTDQFNPVDIALSSLPSLEESRIPLWSLRAIYSLYDVGPLEDVRVEFAANLQNFQAIDLGRCGEPYAVWLVCGKSTALWAHGVTGAGLAGEITPPSPFSDIQGLNFGARVEFRWDRFSFALTDFWGYDTIPSIRQFNSFDRNVDVATGRPLDSQGRLLTPDTALEFASGNRQAFDFGCKASQGFGGNALLALTGGSGTVPDISQRCIGDLLNLQDPISITGSLLGFPVTLVAAPTNVIGVLLAGQPMGDLLADGALNGLDAALANLLAGTVPARLVPLNLDPNDGPSGGGLFGTDCSIPGFLNLLCTNGIAGFPPLNTANLSRYLTVQQEALLGCGSFYQTDCDVQGIDIFNAEASVLLQAFPGFTQNPVATRHAGGRVVILPGARGPGDPGYNINVDGTPPPGFQSEMAALSYNFAYTLAVLGIAEGDAGCVLTSLATCSAIRAVEALTGSQRPEAVAGGNGRYGRRDFAWHGGGEAYVYYNKRNVLGLAMDFAEDVLKSNWSFEFTWIPNSVFASNRTADLTQDANALNLTVSVDRPTFINFLNNRRTFFLNSQFFFRYVPEYDGSFDTNGPFTALGTFTIATGYFQDRLLPALTFVHDFASTSGAVVGQMTYRMTEAISVTAGALLFYGDPQYNDAPLYPLALPDTQTSFRARTRFEGLSPIAERNELFMQLRWTF